MTLTGTQLRQSRLSVGLSQAKLAELSNISQHLLSAFELGKLTLPKQTITHISDLLSDKEKVTTVVKRAKRYRTHEYAKIPKRPERIAKASQTKENLNYKKLLSNLAALHLKKQPRSLSAISLFSGCGGFSLGFSAGGFLVKGFVELEDDLRKIYRKNFPESLEMGSDITAIDDSALKKLSAKIGSVDVIIGGPPCQGFSLSGKRDIYDPRNQLFRHYLRFVDAFRPKVAILENVKLLTSMKNEKGGLVKSDIFSEFGEHGYKINCFEINAKDYGVPQHRERVIFIAVRNDLAFLPSIPPATHGETEQNPDFFTKLLPFRTFADACSDLPYIESGENSDFSLHQAVMHPAHVIEWLWDVPQGFSAHDNQDANKRPPSGYNTTYKRQIWNEPASTVQTTFGMISGCRNVHPIATRALTIREAARIQSFPDEYIFEGSLGTIRTGIGNAVPPLLAYFLAIHLRSLL